MGKFRWRPGVNPEYFFKSHVDLFNKLIPKYPLDDFYVGKAWEVNGIPQAPLSTLQITSVDSLRIDVGGKLKGYSSTYWGGSMNTAFTLYGIETQCGMAMLCSQQYAGEYSKNWALLTRMCLMNFLTANKIGALLITTTKEEKPTFTAAEEMISKELGVLNYTAFKNPNTDNIVHSYLYDVKPYTRSEIEAKISSALFEKGGETAGTKKPEPVRNEEPVRTGLNRLVEYL